MLPEYWLELSCLISSCVLYVLIIKESKKQNKMLKDFEQLLNTQSPELIGGNFPHQEKQPGLQNITKSATFCRPDLGQLIHLVIIDNMQINIRHFTPSH